MPVDRSYVSDDAVWGLWKIEEDEPSLAAIVPHEQVSPAITNSLKRLEVLAGRALIQELVGQWGLRYSGLTKDIHGKPYLSGSDIHISLSHSYPYVAAIAHRTKNVGIDLEQPKEKLLRIAHRVLSDSELRDAGNDVVKHCVYWCAKESLIKIYGKKDLILSRNLLISPFLLQQRGHLVGRILVNNTATAIPLEYIVANNFVVVVSS